MSYSAELQGAGSDPAWVPDSPHPHCDPPTKGTWLQLATDSGYSGTSEHGRHPQELMWWKKTSGESLQPHLFHTGNQLPHERKNSKSRNLAVLQPVIFTHKNKAVPQTPGIIAGTPSHKRMLPTAMKSKQEQVCSGEYCLCSVARQQQKVLFNILLGRINISLKVC